MNCLLKVEPSLTQELEINKKEHVHCGKDSVCSQQSLGVSNPAGIEEIHRSLVNPTTIL